MRIEPFKRNAAPAEPATPVAEQNVRISLKERLALIPRGNTAEPQPAADEATQQPEAEQEKQPGTDSATPPQQEPSATFDEGAADDDPDFKEFKDDIGATIEDLFGDPQDLAKGIIELYGSVRVMILPGRYKAWMFPGQEAKDVDDVVALAIENERAGNKPTDGFDPYQLRLYEKWPRLQQALEKMPFTEKAVTVGAKLLARELKGKKVPALLEKYAFWFWLVGAEIMSAKVIIAQRGGDFISSKVGGK